MLITPDVLVRLRPDAYHKSDYRAAFDIALKLSMRGLWGAHVVLAAPSGQLSPSNELSPRPGGGTPE